ncbi:30S ribosomal protein S16 [bacterium]|nr:30S ribosomal protein S16 [bacterium]
MAVRIRLSRVGKKKVPFYRIVAVDGRKKRDGAYLENLGSYDGINGKLIHFNQERINHWITLGAIPSDAVKKLQQLFKKTGIQVAA